MNGTGNNSNLLLLIYFEIYLLALTFLNFLTLSSPLFYACLAGHEEIVRYLLEKGTNLHIAKWVILLILSETMWLGARCEAGTFDGERCMYAALTREIKMLLKQSHILVHRTDPFVYVLSFPLHHRSTVQLLLAHTSTNILMCNGYGIFSYFSFLIILFAVSTCEKYSITHRIDYRISISCSITATRSTCISMSVL